MIDHTVGLSKLIYRLKNDGVVAGENERNKIIDNAQKQSKTIICDAQIKADKIIRETNRQCEIKKKKLNSELKMAARDFILEFKNKLKNNVILPVVESKVKDVFMQKKFLETCIKDICLESIKQDNCTIKAIVSSDMKEKLNIYFKSCLSKKIMEKSLPILEKQDGLLGFKLKIGNKNFVWDFTCKSIAYEIACLVEPSMQLFLFDQKNH